MYDQREKEQEKIIRKNYSKKFRELLEKYGIKKKHGLNKVDSRLIKGGLPYSKAISCAETFDDVMRCWFIARSPKQEKDAEARMKKMDRTPEQSEQLWRILSPKNEFNYHPKCEVIKRRRRSVYKRKVPQKKYAHG